MGYQLVCPASRAGEAKPRSSGPTRTGCGRVHADARTTAAIRDALSVRSICVDCDGPLVIHRDPTAGPIPCADCGIAIDPQRLGRRCLSCQEVY